MKRPSLYSVLLVLASLSFIAFAMGAVEATCYPTDPEPLTCSSDRDCGDGTTQSPGWQYCQFDEGACGGAGVCVERPGDCPHLWAPVCGCDGQTYSNDCQAAAAGASVAYAGECEGQPCRENGDCFGYYPAALVPLPETYCQKPEGDCDGLGMCAEIPFDCTYEWEPVCGCDGQTYGNRCTAAAAGVNVEYAGECEEPPYGNCTSDDECWYGAGGGPYKVPMLAMYCAKEPGDCEGRGRCTELGWDACDAVYDPVCGCDGQTYGNACEAASMGVNVADAGECHPLPAE